MRAVNYTILLIGLLLPAGLAAQECQSRIDVTASLVSDTHRSLWRAASLLTPAKESGLVRSASRGHWICVDSLQFLAKWQTVDTTRLAILPVEAGVFTNSAYPRSVNDGGAWRGVGLNASLAAGVRGNWKFLRAQVAPQVNYQANGDFVYVQSTAAGLSPFSNAYHNDIDFPTRLGDVSFSNFDAGQSFIEASYKSFAVTLGTENMWVGAAEQYPILMSYTAPGFPHLNLGTRRAVSLPIFDVEAQIMFGSLTESDYFDTKSANNSHYFGITMLALQPRFLPGLWVGVARALHDTATVKGNGPGFFLSRIISSPFGGTHAGNVVNQNAIGWLTARWVMPESGFEAYAEWSKEDTPGGLVDLLREPDWTQAYVLGFQKSVVRKQKLWNIYGELNHLGESAPSRSGRGFFSYYTHATVRQGHTNRGQILGAAIGPGSDAQLLGANLFTAASATGIRIERTRYDDDTYYRTFARRWGETRHDAEITVSANRTQLVGNNIEIGGGVSLSRRYGRMFIPLPAELPDLVENNVSFQLHAAWRPF